MWLVRKQLYIFNSFKNMQVVFRLNCSLIAPYVWRINLPSEMWVGAVL